MAGGSALILLCAALFGASPVPSADRDLLFHPSEIAHPASLFTPFQIEALAAVNRYRALLELPAMRLDPALCTAAQSHSRYLDTNKRFGHDEQTGLAGFTGTMPWDRARTAGYPHGCTEDVSSNPDPEGAIHQLMAAPYHRIPFLEPTPVALGVGQGRASTTLEFDGKPGAAGVVVYPADGQGGVPPAWSGRETPNPLRMHAARAPVGYVVSYHAFLVEGTKVTFRGARLVAEDGEMVPCYRNTPENDDKLENALLLIPARPLRPGTRYRATVEAVAGQGLDISRTWSFVTAGVSNDPRLALVVQGRPGGFGALLSLRITNRGAKSTGPLQVAVSAPGKPEVRAALPAISPGEVVEAGLSVKSAYGQVRLLSAPKGGKPMQVCAPAKFDVRSAARQ